MALQTGELKDIAVFFLTPELSSTPMPPTIPDDDETAGPARWTDHAKTMVWIAASIMLALALGQLH